MAGCSGSVFVTSLLHVLYSTTVLLPSSMMLNINELIVVVIYEASLFSISGCWQVKTLPLTTPYPRFT